MKISKGRSCAYKRSGDEGLNPAESSERSSHSCAKSLEEEGVEEEEERGKEKQAERDARRSGRTTNSLVGLSAFISLSSLPAF